MDTAGTSPIPPARRAPSSDRGTGVHSCAACRGPLSRRREVRRHTASKVAANRRARNARAERNAGDDPGGRERVKPSMPPPKSAAEVIARSSTPANRRAVGEDDDGVTMCGAVGEEVATSSEAMMPRIRAAVGSRACRVWMIPWMDRQHSLYIQESSRPRSTPTAARSRGASCRGEWRPPSTTEPTSVAVGVLDNRTGEWLAWEGSGDYSAQIRRWHRRVTLSASTEGLRRSKPVTYAWRRRAAIRPPRARDVPSHFATCGERKGSSTRRDNYDGRWFLPRSAARCAPRGRDAENVPAVAMAGSSGPGVAHSAPPPRRL